MLEIRLESRWNEVPSHLRLPHLGDFIRRRFASIRVIHILVGGREGNAAHVLAKCLAFSMRGEQKWLAQRKKEGRKEKRFGGSKWMHRFLLAKKINQAWKIERSTALL